MACMAVAEIPSGKQAELHSIPGETPEQDRACPLTGDRGDSETGDSETAGVGLGCPWRVGSCAPSPWAGCLCTLASLLPPSRPRVAWGQCRTEAGSFQVSKDLGHSPLPLPRPAPLSPWLSGLDVSWGGQAPGKSDRVVLPGSP